MANINELDKMKILIDNGWIYDYQTSQIKNIKNSKLHETKNGYQTIDMMVERKRIRVYAHRFVYFYCQKEIPNIIDHIDGDRLNNNINNLRNINQQKNSFNRKDKVKGFVYNKKCNKYEARIKLNNKHIYLGLFETEDEATKAYLEAKKIYHII